MEGNMAFEKFTRIRSRGYTPQISIWSRGQIGLNQAVLDKYKIGEYAILFFDRDTKRVGIKFTNNKSESGAAKIIKRKTGGASLSARAFLVNYDLISEKTKSYNVEFDKDNEMLIIKVE